MKFPNKKLLGQCCVGVVCGLFTIYYSLRALKDIVRLPYRSYKSKRHKGIIKFFRV